MRFTSCAADAVVETVLADLTSLKIAIKAALKEKNLTGMDAVFTEECKKVVESFIIIKELLEKYDVK